MKQYFTTRHKPIWLLLLASGLWAEKSVAQQGTPPPKTEYLATDGKMMPSAAGARYRRETIYSDSIGGTVRDYYVGGILQETKSFDNIRRNIPNGTFESWHENGQLESHQEFIHGKQAGERRLYYVSGQLKRQEKYQDGERTTGMCYDTEGRQLPFFEYEVMPVYPEGLGDQRAIATAVARSIRYPKDALRAGIEGKVFVKFTVTDGGKVANIEVLEGLSPSIDAETVRAVQQLRRFKPGLQDGKAVAVAFTLPVSYNIDKKPTRSFFGGVRTTYELPKE